MALNEAKREVQKQWDADPCAADTVDGQERETLEYYRAIRAHRYGDYGPWFDRAMRFDEWRSRDILEVGVGLGSDHFRFARNGNRMTALDLSREHLRHTALHLRLEGLGTHPVYGDAERLPFESDSFDLVYSFGALHHTPDTDAAIEEVRRVLRPGGQALIGLYHRDSYFYWGVVMAYWGLLQGKLWRLGRRGLLSEVEHRRDRSSASPLVKTYSRRQVRRLFERFSRADVTVCHVHPGRKVQQLVPGVRSVLERYLGWCGWYLVVRAWK